MIVIACKNGHRYAFEFAIDVDSLLITETGDVIFEPHPDVLATLEFPTPAVKVEQTDEVLAA